MNTIIHSDNFTDSNGELHYFNTGRDNVSGLHFPTHYIQNPDKYKYTRIINISLNSDTSLIYPVHECFLLTVFRDYNEHGITNLVTVDALVKNGTIRDDHIKITCTPLNYHANNLSGKSHTIKAALASQSIDGVVNMTLGIWLLTDKALDIVIKDLTSLSYNEVPNNIYHQFLQCDYEAIYLDNEKVAYDVNMFNYEQSIGSVIGESININKTVCDKIEKMETQLKVSVPDYQFMSVVYDDMYYISKKDVDEVIKPTSKRYVKEINDFVDIYATYFKVKDAGNYLIALKVDMDINVGNNTEMMISLFVNDDRIEETTTRLALNPSNKVHPRGFIAGQFQIQLSSSDKVYLKARWTKNDNVKIENHCSVQITRLNKLV